jgi:hypothetical protein
LSSPDPYRLLAPIGMIGYGIVERSLALGAAAGPDVIGADGGSVDAGPYYLGSGLSFTSGELVTRDLSLCLRAAEECAAPVVVGTAGGAGAEPHLAFALDCLRAAAREAGRAGLRVALVHAEQPRERVRAWVAEGRTQSFSGGPLPTSAAVDACERIVAQMGIAAVGRALDEQPDVVLAGRASDVAIFAAPAIRAGGDPALAVHLGKVIECGAHCAEPASGRDAILAELYHDRFQLRAPNPERRCTPEGVIAHMLYENAHPYRLAEPDGVCDLSDVTVEAVDDRTVSASGARFEPSDRLVVKIEGAAAVGYRSLVIGGMRDPRLVAAVDDVLAVAEAAVAGSLGSEEYRLAFHVYGRDGVLGASERDGRGQRELGVVCEAVAGTQRLAHAVAQAAEAALITAPYPGGISATGNLAVPFSPLVVDAGRAYEWSVFCLADVEEREEELFPVEVVTL